MMIIIIMMMGNYYNFYRNLFNWFALILFFYNGLAGLVKGIIRIVYSAAIGLLLIFRLDYVVFAQYFAFLDKGTIITNC